MGNSSLPGCEAASAWAKGRSGEGTCTTGKGTSLSIPESEAPDTQGIVGLGNGWGESEGELTATEGTGMQSIHTVHGSGVLRTKVSTGLGGGHAGPVLLRLFYIFIWTATFPSLNRYQDCRFWSLQIVNIMPADKSVDRRGVDAFEEVMSDISHVTGLNTPCAARGVAQAAISLQVACQGTGLVNFCDVDMAMH
jgi:hypothetical protein